LPVTCRPAAHGLGKGATLTPLDIDAPCGATGFWNRSSGAQELMDLWDYAVQLSFDNVNSPELAGYGVDHVKVAEGLGCQALRVHEPAEMVPAFEQAQKLMVEHRVPVVVEIILERVTNISMGTEIDNITEFEELAEHREHAPTSVALLD
jgi:tartronate-semialdehyde synthase